MTVNNFKDKSAKTTDVMSVVRRILPYAAALLTAGIGIGLVLYYIIGPSEWYMTADCTDSLLWSQATFESGKLVSEDFYYAAVIPFGGNLIFLPFIALFGYSMTAQICGLCTYAVLLFAAVIYLGRGLGYKWYTAGGMLSLLVLIMSSSAKLREIMWEHIFYYNLGILFFCLGMGLAVRIFREGGFIDTDEKKATDIVLIGVLSIFAMICATNGLQSLVCFILPVLAAMFAALFLDSEIKLISKQALCALIVIFAVGICTLVGMKLTDSVTGGITAAYQEAYSTYSAMGTWVNNFLGLFNNWFTLLGVSVSAGDPMMSVESVINMIRIFCGLFLLVAPIVMLCGYRSIKSRGVRMLLVGHLAVMAFIIFASVFGSLGGANWRLTPMLGTSVLVAFAYAVDLIGRKKAAARVGAVMLAFLILTAGISALEIKEMKAGEYDKYDAHLITYALEERGLERGYATFWRSQIITMLSDSRVECAVILDGASEPIKRNYQSSDSWYEDGEDTNEYFLLLDSAENVSYATWRAMNVHLQTDSFVITNANTGVNYYVYVYSENIVKK